MKLNPIVTFVTAVVVAGFTPSLAAQEKLKPDQTDKAAAVVVSEREITVDTVPSEITPPAPVMVQTEEKFLSEMKVYPAF